MIFDLLVSIGVFQFFALTVYFAIACLRVVVWVSRQECNLPVLYSVFPSSAIIYYENWCREKGKEINQVPIKAFKLSKKVFISSFLFFIATLVLKASFGD
jgi:hypothetical protein